MKFKQPLRYIILCSITRKRNRRVSLFDDTFYQVFLLHVELVVSSVSMSHAGSLFIH